MPSEWNFPWIYYKPLFDDSEIMVENKEMMMEVNVVQE